MAGLQPPELAGDMEHIHGHQREGEVSDYHGHQREATAGASRPGGSRYSVSFHPLSGW